MVLCLVCHLYLFFFLVASSAALCMLLLSIFQLFSIFSSLIELFAIWCSKRFTYSCRVDSFSSDSILNFSTYIGAFFLLYVRPNLNLPRTKLWSEPMFVEFRLLIYRICLACIVLLVII